MSSSFVLSEKLGGFKSVLRELYECTSETALSTEFTGNRCNKASPSVREWIYRDSLPLCGFCLDKTDRIYILYIQPCCTFWPVDEKQAYVDSTHFNNSDKLSRIILSTFCSFFACATSGRAIFVDINMKRLGIRFKTNGSVIQFRVNSFFWETITLYTVHFQIKKFAGCFHSLRAVTHCMKGNFQKSIMGAL